MLSCQLRNQEWRRGSDLDWSGGARKSRSECTHVHWVLGTNVDALESGIEIGDPGRARAWRGGYATGIADGDGGGCGGSWRGRGCRREDGWRRRYGRRHGDVILNGWKRDVWTRIRLWTCGILTASSATRGGRSVGGHVGLAKTKMHGAKTEVKLKCEMAIRCLCLTRWQTLGGRRLARSYTSLMAMLWAKIDHPARRGVATTEGLKHSTVSSKANPVLNPGHQSR